VHLLDDNNPLFCLKEGETAVNKAECFLKQSFAKKLKNVLEDLAFALPAWSFFD